MYFSYFYFYFVIQVFTLFFSVLLFYGSQFNGFVPFYDDGDDRPTANADPAHGEQRGNCVALNYFFSTPNNVLPCNFFTFSETQQRSFGPHMSIFCSVVIHNRASNNSVARAQRNDRRPASILGGRF